MSTTLKKSPIVLSIAQIKYKIPEKFDITKFYNAEKVDHFRDYFPHRNSNYNANILGIEGGTPAPGISTIRAKADTKINIITYSSEDKKQKIIIDLESITFSDESKYTSWDEFKEKTLMVFSFFRSVLSEIFIERVSIRFVNRFEIKPNEPILNYFKMVISSESQVSFPIVKYSFRYAVDILNDNIYAIVNHATEPMNNLIVYLLDIDALKKVDFIFNENQISTCLDELRGVKNTIFFENITNKTVELCNSHQ